MARAKKDKSETTKKRPGKVENLVSLGERSTDEQRRIASMGGKKSVEVRREKKLMSAIYADFLAKKHKVKLDDEGEKEIDGNELMEIVARNILERGDGASVSLMKEIREATEGSSIALTTHESPIDPDKLDEATKQKIAQAYVASIEGSDAGADNSGHSEDSAG